MAEVTKKTVIRQSTGNVAVDDNDATDGQILAARVIWFVTGVLEVILGFRFLLSFLGANRANAFADFIYSLSRPFVAPFFGLFSYNPTYGRSHFELYTLIAMLVYAAIAYGLVRLVLINRDDVEV